MTGEEAPESALANLVQTLEPFWPLLIVAGVCLIFMIIYTGVEVWIEGNGDFLPANRFLPKPKVDPVIAYKTAELFPLGHSLFQGVGGRVGYDAIDEANDYGFHMYDSISDALQHPQGSNAVFMEVVGYGDVVKWSYGYTTSHQKVLQVILGRCASHGCKEQGEFWVYHEGYYTVQPRRPDQARVAVFCRDHSIGIVNKTVKVLRWRMDLPSLKIFNRKDLEALLEAKAGYHIPVVGEREGYDLPQYKRSTVQLDKIKSIS